jgi:hypothetical protein
MLRHEICCLFFLVSFLCICCNTDKKEFNPPYDMGKIWEIHHQTTWDSLSTANHLVGKWKWNYSFCCGEGWPNETFTNDKNFIIQFFDDGTLEVFENNISQKKSTWYPALEDGHLYGIVVNPTIIQLYGRILFDENGVLFDDAYRDGANNYYIRVE